MLPGSAHIDTEEVTDGANSSPPAHRARSTSPDTATAEASDAAYPQNREKAVPSFTRHGIED